MSPPWLWIFATLNLLVLAVAALAVRQRRRRQVRDRARALLTDPRLLPLDDELRYSRPSKEADAMLRRVIEEAKRKARGG